NAELVRQAHELQLAKEAAENAQKAAESAQRAEAAEKDRAIRFEEAARVAEHKEQSAVRRAQIARRFAYIAGIGIIGLLIAAAAAIAQIAIANAQLATATIAQGKAIDAGDTANTRVAVAGTTLTPISPTLTAVGIYVDTQTLNVESLQFASTALLQSGD